MRITTLALLSTLPLMAGPVALRAQNPADLSMSTYAGISVTGEVGRVYAIESSNVLGTTNEWRTAAVLQLPASPFVWFDLESTLSTQRFYRVSTVPVQPATNMVFIPPGVFMLGSPSNAVDRGADEGPRTAVTLPFGFWMGIHEVTQQEYADVTGLPNPSHWAGDSSRPVESVSWRDATNYCAMLTARERNSDRIPEAFQYRLPTEAEWEYACRAGTLTRFSYGDDPGYEALEDFAWYAGNSDGMTRPVGRRLPNPWGLRDMHGNVWEWCWDWYGPYPGGSVTAPGGPDTGETRVVRGGSWFVEGADCRSANRFDFNPARDSRGIGFRVVLAVVPAEE